MDTPLFALQSPYIISSTGRLMQLSEKSFQNVIICIYFAFFLSHIYKEVSL